MEASSVWRMIIIGMAVGAIGVPILALLKGASLHASLIFGIPGGAICAIVAGLYTWAIMRPWR